MRKLAAILLLLVLFFNLGGYRFIFTVLQSKADSRLEASIDDKEYDDTDLVEMRIALNMPYQERFTGFERHYGEININGKAYTYVERKVEGGVLVLRCIANHSRIELKKIADGWIKSNSGQQQGNSPEKISFAKLFNGEYDDKSQFCSLSLNDLPGKMLLADYSSALQRGTIRTPFQPPKTSVFFS